MSKRLKHKLVVRDGKVVDITGEEVKSATSTFHIGKSNGLNWRSTSSNTKWYKDGKWVSSKGKKINK